MLVDLLKAIRSVTMPLVVAWNIAFAASCGWHSAERLFGG